jgi:putative holliday junction resolvase
MKLKTMAVDPGDKRIGLAVSDPGGMVAFPYKVIIHTNREDDAQNIVNHAIENQVELIVVGQALNFEGELTASGRKAARLAESIKTGTSISVELWDESNSTNEARQARILIKAPRNKRKGHLDEIAATFILQTFLDSHQ